MAIKEIVELSENGRIFPTTVLVTIENGATFHEQTFVNQSRAPVTLVLPAGLSPDGSIFGIGAEQTASIRISACAPRQIEIPYGVFFADEGIRDWGEGNSPPTMKVGP